MLTQTDASLDPAHVLLAITITFAVTSAYMRRYVWRNQWERPITLAMLLGLVGLILQSPLAEPLGPAYEALVGREHPVDVWANTFYLAAQGCWLYALSKRVSLSDRGRTRFINRAIMLPWTVVSPALAGAFWTCPHWVVDTIIDVWLCSNQILLLWLLWIIVRDDRRARMVTWLYVAGTAKWACGIFLQAIHRPEHNECWACMCVGMCIFATAAALSQHLKRKHFRDVARQRIIARQIEAAKAQQDSQQQSGTQPN